MRSLDEVNFGHYLINLYPILEMKYHKNEMYVKIQIFMLT